MAISNIGIKHALTKRKAKKKVKKMAKKMAKKYIQEQLQKAGFKAKTKPKASSLLNQWMTKLIFFIALVGPILTLPQIRNVRYHKQAQGLSLFTRGAYVFGNTCWLIYGIINKERAIIFGNILWIIVNFTVLMGVILYK